MHYMLREYLEEVTKTFSIYRRNVIDTENILIQLKYSVQACRHKFKYIIYMLRKAVVGRRYKKYPVFL